MVGWTSGLVLLLILPAARVMLEYAMFRNRMDVLLAYLGIIQFWMKDEAR